MQNFVQNDVSMIIYAQLTQLILSFATSFTGFDVLHNIKISKYVVLSLFVKITVQVELLTRISGQVLLMLT